MLPNKKSHTVKLNMSLKIDMTEELSSSVRTSPDLRQSTFWESKLHELLIPKLINGFAKLGKIEKPKVTSLRATVGWAVFWLKMLTGISPGWTSFSSLLSQP